MSKRSKKKDKKKSESARKRFKQSPDYLKKGPKKKNK